MILLFKNLTMVFFRFIEKKYEDAAIYGLLGIINLICLWWV